MINRNINSLSYDKNKNKEQNKFSTNNIKKYKLKTYVSPKMRYHLKGTEIDSNNKNNEIQKNLLEKNMGDSLDILNEKDKIKNTDNSQSDTTFKSPEKNNIKLLIKKNYEYIDNINEKETKEEIEIVEKNNSNIIHNKEYNKINDFQKSRNYFANKYNNLDKENESNNYIIQNSNNFVSTKNDIKNKGLFNSSLIDFRKSNYLKYRQERGKGKFYNSKRFNKNYDEPQIKEKKEIKIYPTRNKFQIDKDKNNDKIDYINQLFLKKKNENNKINGVEESSQSTQRIEDNYIEENENEIKKVDISGYRYKIKNRPKTLELKNEILSEINNIKNQIITNEKNNDNDIDNNTIHKKIEINTTIESNYDPSNLNDYKNENNDFKYNSVDKYNSLKNATKSNIKLGIYVKNNIENKNFYPQHNSQKENNSSCSFKSKNNNDLNYRPIYINQNNTYKSHNIYTNNITTMTNDKNNIQKIEKENNQISDKNKKMIKINNLLEYKYNYYIHKRNRKLKKFNNEYNYSKISLDISTLMKDLQRIKNSKKKRFHREINKKDE